MARALAKQELRNIVNETVEDVLNRIGMVNEMAVRLKDYKHRVDVLRFRMVENWCLAKWCQLFDPECENFQHWINELKACMDNLKYLDIKNGIDKRKTLIKMLVKDYDYDNVNMIERIIRGKFAKENITDINQKITVCKEFADNITNLIDAISIDSIEIEHYLEQTFINN